MPCTVVRRGNECKAFGHGGQRSAANRNTSINNLGDACGAGTQLAAYIRVRVDMALYLHRMPTSLTPAGPAGGCVDVLPLRRPYKPPIRVGELISVSKPEASIWHNHAVDDPQAKKSNACAVGYGRLTEKFDDQQTPEHVPTRMFVR